MLDGDARGGRGDINSAGILKVQILNRDTRASAHGEDVVLGEGCVQDRGRRRSSRCGQREFQGARYIQGAVDGVGAGRKNDERAGWGTRKSALECALGHATVQVDGGTAAPPWG